MIHAGLYYPAGSLKARLCVEGRELLYAFCARHGVPHARCGKLIVAHDEQRAAGARGAAAARHAQRRRAARDRRPRVHRRARAGASTRGGGALLARHRHRQRRRTGEGAAAHRRGGGRHVPAGHQAASAPIRHADGIDAAHRARNDPGARTVVNAAGLYADEVSRMLGGETFTIYPCRGEYAELTPAKRSLVNALVYPLPHARATGSACTSCGRPAAQVLARTDDPLPGPQGRLRERPAAARSIRRAGAAADRRRHHRRSAAVGQRHPRQAAPADRVVRRLPDPPRPREPGGRPGRRHRLARTDRRAWRSAATGRAAYRRSGGCTAGYGSGASASCQAAWATPAAAACRSTARSTEARCARLAARRRTVHRHQARLDAEQPRDLARQLQPGARRS